jgi:hypothetical protein
MKQITAQATYLGNNVWEVAISDMDAMTACLTRSWTGWSADDALRAANAKLNLFGYAAVLEEVRA